MTKGKKYVVAATEVCEMLLIKAERPVNPIASTIKQTQENLYSIWNSVRISEEEKVRLYTEELKKLRRVEDDRNSTAHPL